MYKFANIDLLRKHLPIPIVSELILFQILSIKTLIINYTYSKENEIIELSITCFARVFN